MAVQITGVRAVVQDYQSFASTLKEINGLYASIGESAKKAAQDVNALGASVSKIKAPKATSGVSAASSAMSGMGAAVGGMTGGPMGALAGMGLDALGGIGGQIQSFVSGIVSSIGNALGNIAQIAMGIITAQVFNRIADGIGTMAQTAFEAATSFQMLRVRLQGLVAKDMRASDSTLTMADSLQQAKQGAQELFSWISVLSIKTPFTRDSLSNALSMSMAYGLNVDEAKKLTVAVGDFVAGMGLEQDKMQQVITALGRMQGTGRATGEMIAMLRDASVNINDIFDIMATNTGKTTEELKKMQEQGILPASDFLQAFIDLSSKDFGGSMERMGATWQTVTSNIQDFIGSMIGIEAMGPALDTVTAQMGSALERLMQPDVQGFFRAVGSILSSFVNDALGMVPNMYTYGANLMTSFADGVIAGANMLLDVLSQIGNMIAEWLSPGSPPKLLPDIDDWGTAAIGEWLQGFTEADFGVLDSLQKPIKSALEQVMGKDDAGKAFADISKAMMASLGAGGAGSEDLFANIAASTGEFGTQVSNLARLEFGLAQATNDVASAQERINAARKVEEDSYATVQALAKEYNAMRRAGASKAELGAKLSELNAAKMTMKQAKDQRKQSEKDLATSQEKEKSLKGQIDLQAKVVDEMLELSDAAKDANKELKGAGKIGGAGAGLGGGLAKKLVDSMGDPAAAVAGMVDGFKQDFLDRWNGFVSDLQSKLAPWKEIWDRISNDPIGALGNLWNAFKSGEMMVDIAAFLGDPAEKLGEWTGKAIGWMLTDGARLLEYAFGQILINSPAVLNAIGMGATYLAIRFMSGFIKGLADAMPDHTAALTTFGMGIAAPVILGIDTSWLAFTTRFFVNFMTWLMGLSAAALLQWGIFKTKFIEVAYELRTQVGENVQSMKDGIMSSLGDLVAYINKNVAEAFSGLGGIMDSVTNGAAKAIQGAFDGLKSAAEGVAGAIGKIGDAIRGLPSLPSYITPGSPTPFEIGLRGINAALKQGYQQTLPAYSARVSGMAAPQMSALQPAPMTTNNNNRTLHYEPHYQTAPANANQDLSVMQVMWGTS